MFLHRKYWKVFPIMTMGQYKREKNSIFMLTLVACLTGRKEVYYHRDPELITCLLALLLYK